MNDAFARDVSPVRPGESSGIRIRRNDAREGEVIGKRATPLTEAGAGVRMRVIRAKCPVKKRGGISEAAFLRLTA